MATKTLMTIEEFERLAETEDEAAYELDEGELVEIPDRTMIHNVARGKTERLLGNHLSLHRDQGFVVAEEKFRLFDKVVRHPDIALVEPDQRESIKLAREHSTLRAKACDRDRLAHQHWP